MVTKEEYENAILQRDSYEDIIREYLEQKRNAFDKRLKTNPIFTDDELFYSATARCPCGAGLAYPKDCGPFHYWDCSNILKGIQDNSMKHTDQLPFTMYEVKGESEVNGTTRPSKDNK